MKYANRLLLCLLTVLAMAGSVTGCGRQAESSADKNTQTETVTAEQNAEHPEDADDSEDDADDDAPIREEDIVIQGETKKSTTASTTVTEKPSSSTAKASSTAKSSGTATTKTTAKPASTTTAPATEAPTEAPTEENAVSGVLDLSSRTFEGSGVSVSGDTMTITGEGTYILSGTMTGMIEVNSPEKVKLKLNNVNINNPNGPAIQVTDAKKLTITLIEGTANFLSDNVNEAGKGTISSNDTLEIKGSGGLYIDAKNAHGISSDDDIIIKNGEIHITSNKSGMMANDDITISGGNVYVTGRTNGIKSKGTLNIEGGNIWCVGGEKESKSCLYSEGVFTITGGCVYAVGCGASVPDAGTSTQKYICKKLEPSAPAGTVDFGGIMQLTSPYAYNTVFISTPQIYDGMELPITASGELR